MKSKKFVEMTFEKVYEFINEMTDKWEARRQLLFNGSVEQGKSKYLKFRRYENLNSGLKYKDIKVPIKGPWKKGDSQLPDEGKLCLIFTPFSQYNSIPKDDLSVEIGGHLAVAYLANDIHGFRMADIPVPLRYNYHPYFWMYVDEINT